MILNELEKNIGYIFKNTEYLIMAVTHKSYYHEKRSRLNTQLTHNEKLEFLGDAVLDLVLGEMLFFHFHDDSEGNLSKKRAALVNEDTLSEIAQSLKIQDYILLGKGENSTGGLQKPRLLSSTYEAIIGAIYRDGGFDTVKKIVQNHFIAELDKLSISESDFVKDYKTRFQELTQKKFKTAPKYELFSEEGPSHERVFFVNLILNDQIISTAQGRSKKQAEQEAAKKAFEVLNEPIV